MNDELIHDRLLQILREGDPAAQESGLSPDEVHAMRRTVLTSIPESHRRLSWLPVLVAGTAALILLILAFGPWRQRGVAPPPAPRMAAVPTPVPAPSVKPEPAVLPERPAQSPKPAHRRTVQPRRSPAVPRDEPMNVASLPDTPASAVREIRFSTPGGTRIIWELPTNDAR